MSVRLTPEEAFERVRMNLWTQAAGYAALILFCAVLLDTSCTVAHAARDAYRESQSHTAERHN